jgi:hypothetical protein
MRKALLGLLAIVSVLFVVPATAGATDHWAPKPPKPTGAQVYVTHGLPLPDSVTGPGTPVDVYVNGALLLDDFKFGTTVGPLTLPAATYDVQVRTPDGVTTLIDKSVAVPAKGNFSLVASYIDAAGTPGINVFANDISKPWRGNGAIALHHAAAAPAVDIDAGLYPFTRFFPQLKKTIVSGATNGAQARFVLPTFLRYTVDVRVSGTKTVVLPVDNVKVSRNVLTNVYVVGSAAGGTLQALVTTIPTR